MQKRKKQEEEKGVGWSLLLSVVAVTLLATAAELVLAQMTHCISLLVLAYQNIYNLLTLLMSVWMKAKGAEPGLGKTFGWRRMEVVGSIVSLMFLFSLCFATFIEALQTIFHAEHHDTMHHPDWILGALGGQVGVWGVAYMTIGGYSHHQIRAVSQGSIRTKVADIGRDLLGVMFTGVICSLVLFKVMIPVYASYLDPVGSMIYIATLVWTCVPLVRDSCLILLQTIPGNVEVSQLKKFILQKFPGILSLHEVHVWTLTPREMVLTAHVTYQNRAVYTDIHGQVASFFSAQGFSQITLQPEFPECETLTRQDSPSCTLACKGAHCSEMSCCNDALGHPEEECCDHKEGEHAETTTFLE